MKRLLPTVATMTVTLAFAGACGENDDGTDTAAASLDGARGEEVYQARCASCHGADLEGTDKGPSHLSIVYEPGHHGDASFRSAIENGAPQHHWPFGDMPAIEGLSADEIEAVIAYVRSEQQRQGLHQ